MGRGRAKAKQTKVARDLKYRTYDTDFSSLERELSNSTPDDAQGAGEDDSDDDASSFGESGEDEAEGADDDADHLSRKYG